MKTARLSVIELSLLVGQHYGPQSLEVLSPES